MAASDDFDVVSESDDYTDASIMPVFLSIRNPLDIGADPVFFNNADHMQKVLARHGVPHEEDTSVTPLEALAKDLRSAGYDGLVYTNSVEDRNSQSYVALDRNKIKSSTDNNGEFDAGNDNILFQIQDVDSPEEGTLKVEGSLHRNINDVHSTLLYGSDDLLFDAIEENNYPEIFRDNRESIAQFDEEIDAHDKNRTYDANDVYRPYVHTPLVFRELGISDKGFFLYKSKINQIVSMIKIGKGRP